jgi:DNA-binding transcriptional regulator YiaG
MTGPEAVQIIDSLGVSQRQFALMIGAHPNTPTNWKNGGAVPGPTATLLELLRDRPELIEWLKARGSRR